MECEAKLNPGSNSLWTTTQAMQFNFLFLLLYDDKIFLSLNPYKEAIYPHRIYPQNIPYPPINTTAMKKIKSKNWKKKEREKG